MMKQKLTFDLSLLCWCLCARATVALATQMVCACAHPQLGRIKTTGVPMERLKALGRAMCRIPEDFNVHRKIKKIYDKRTQSIETGEGIDWGTAEALAFATLLQVRVTLFTSSPPLSLLFFGE